MQLPANLTVGFMYIYCMEYLSMPKLLILINHLYHDHHPFDKHSD